MWTKCRGLLKSSPNIVQNQRPCKRKREYLIFFVNCNETFHFQNYVNLHEPPPPSPAVPAKSRTILWIAPRPPPYLGADPGWGPPPPRLSPPPPAGRGFFDLWLFSPLDNPPSPVENEKTTGGGVPSAGFLPSAAGNPIRRPFRIAVPGAFWSCSGCFPAGCCRPPGPPAVRPPPWRGPGPSGRFPQQWRQP